ncbi:ATPeF1G [Lepeophtheirus salmonis]|uniref:F-ATPase gamma subunit n=1 Tax=Lepeophtheirus salmonis TaxID=72036 RepID=A0A7R8CIT4_LEPSM|nr:ATPeF1G [Lepeophtheirus salmonis]CAF2836363.1 ATPeF1G [Lepeophtheirus salmonis]
MNSLFTRSKTCLYQQERGMANLKAIAMRLKSVKNIQKITQSMKMVSAAKYARAERDLKAARPYGNGTKAFYEKTEVDSKEEAPKELIVALTSDRGLCGAVHSSIYKSRAQLQRFFAKNILMVGSEIGRLPPQFGDASKIASNIMQSGFEYDVGRLMYNKFKSVVSYKTTTLNIFSKDSVAQAEKLSVYDSIDDDVLQSYLEYNLASLIYYCLKEGACSEQSSRMTAMDNSSKNAGEMIDKLTLTYNRTRQAVITGELIEIISGAAAL